MTNDDATPVELLFQRAENYSKTTIELGKLQVIDKSAELLSTIAARFVVIITVASSIIIINIGIALWIGQLLGNHSYGFLIVGGFYAIISILLHIYRHIWIKLPIRNSLISHLLKNTLYEKRNGQ